jgi:hypothetical protein
MAGTIEPEIPGHSTRWQHIPSLQHWFNNVDIMREFADKRPVYQWHHIREHFDLGELITVTVKTEEPDFGRVQVNSIVPGLKVLSAETITEGWSGSYFPEIPLRLEAKPEPGREFSHWYINGERKNDRIIGLLPDENLTARAVFRTSDSPATAFPAPFALYSGNPYSMTNWPATAQPGSFPESMAFVYMQRSEPNAAGTIAGFTYGAYDLNSRTRINGLGDEGFSFINTGNADGNPGFPGTRLGGALLALDTRENEAVKLGFTAGTLFRNSRIYQLSLEYRTNPNDPFKPFKDSDGVPVVYSGDQQAGHSKRFEDIWFPDELINRPYVQLFWRYHFSGIRLDSESGQRSQLRIADITVNGLDSPTTPELPVATRLLPNYPNPFNSNTVIQAEFSDDFPSVSIRIYDVTGRLVAEPFTGPAEAGILSVPFNAGNLASRVYIIRLRAPGISDTEKMMLIK